MSKARINKKSIRKLSTGEHIYEVEDMKLFCDECHTEVKLSSVVDLKTMIYKYPYGNLGVCPLCDMANGIEIPKIETLEEALKRK